MSRPKIEVDVAVFASDYPEDRMVARIPHRVDRARAVAWVRRQFAEPGRQADRAWFECYYFDGFEWVPTGETGEQEWDEEFPRWFGR